MARHSPWSDVKDPDFAHPLSAVRSNDSPSTQLQAAPGWNSKAAKAWNSCSPNVNRRNMSSESAPPKLANGEKDLWSRFEQVKGLESYKNALIEEALVRCEYLNEECQRLKDDYDRDLEHVAIFQRNAKMHEDHARKLKSLMNRDPFVVILIDGNHLLFDDQLVQAAEYGGAQTARLLCDQLKNYLTRNLPDIPTETKILARIYVDFEYVGEACWQAGIIDRPSKFNDFVKGFMREENLFDIVDVSLGKGFAEAKIADFFKLHLYDYHCRQIFFGCSSSQVWSSLLDRVANEEQSTKRVTLLEGLPFGDDFENLPFERAKFSNIFRSSKLEYNASNPRLSVSRPPLDGLPAPTPPPMQAMAQMDLKEIKDYAIRMPMAQAASVSTESQSKPSPATTWASAVKAAAPVQPPSIQSTPTKPTTPTVPRNRKGQRVDPIIKHDKDEVDRVKKKKWCNVHFLRNECQYGDSCTHVHHAKPTQAELQTLRLVARMAPCMNGSDCEDVKCIYGHICPAPEGRDGKDCIFGDNCRFPSHLHKIDRNVVKTVKV